MGYIGREITYFKENGTVDRKREVESWMSKLEIIKSSMVGSIYYAAIREKKDGPVFAVIIPTYIEDGSLMLKLMDETDEPLYFDCPISIINLLSPTTDEEVLYWRNKCIENANKKRKGRKKKEALKTQNTEK